MQKAVVFLQGNLSPIASVGRLTPMLLRLTDPVQLSAALASYSWPQGPDSTRIKQALLGWLHYVDDSHLAAVTDSVKQKALRELLSILPSEDICWKSCATKLLVAMSDTCSADELDPLLSVCDRASMARTLSVLTVNAPQLSTLKALRHHLHRLICPVQSMQPEWADQMVNQFLVAGGLSRDAASPPSLPQIHAAPESRVGICVRITGPGVPWSLFQAALAAHFSDDAFVGPQNAEMVSYVYASVGQSAWQRVTGGRPEWSIPLGAGRYADITTRRADGTPYDPPRRAAPQQTYSNISVPSQKRSRSPSMYHSDTQMAPSRGSSSSMQGAPIPAARWVSPPILRQPIFRANPRALVTRRGQGRRGPGNL